MKYNINSGGIRLQIHDFLSEDNSNVVFFEHNSISNVWHWKLLTFYYTVVISYFIYSFIFYLLITVRQSVHLMKTNHMLHAVQPSSVTRSSRSREPSAWNDTASLQTLCVMTSRSVDMRFSTCCLLPRKRSLSYYHHCRVNRRLAISSQPPYSSIAGSFRCYHRQIDEPNLFGRYLPYGLQNITGHAAS